MERVLIIIAKVVLVIIRMTTIERIIIIKNINGIRI